MTKGERQSQADRCDGRRKGRELLQSMPNAGLTAGGWLRHLERQLVQVGEGKGKWREGERWERGKKRKDEGRERGGERREERDEERKEGGREGRGGGKRGGR